MNAIFGPETFPTDSFGASGESPMTLVMALPGEAVHLPQGFDVTTADFARASADLVLTGADGGQIVVQNFFAYGDAPNLISAQGATLSGHLAAQLSGPLAPGQYAQAGPGAVSEPIGTVETVTGEAHAVHADGTRELLQTGDQIFQGDVVETAGGAAVGILLADETTFSMAENGRIVMDELVYDPGAQTGSLNLSVVTGVFAFVSGQIAKSDPDAMVLNTPVATVGIRGTQMGCSYEEARGLQVVLMEEQNGFVGELVIANAAGTVVLDQGNQGTTVLSAADSPTDPVILTDSAVTEVFGSTMAYMPGNDNFNSYGVTPAFGDQGQNDANPDNFETAAGSPTDADVSFTTIGFDLASASVPFVPPVSVVAPPPAIGTPTPTPPVIIVTPPTVEESTTPPPPPAPEGPHFAVWSDFNEVRSFSYAGDMAGGPNQGDVTWTNHNGMAPLLYVGGSINPISVIGSLSALFSQYPGEGATNPGGYPSLPSATMSGTTGDDFFRGSRTDSDFDAPLPGAYTAFSVNSGDGTGEWIDETPAATTNSILADDGDDFLAGQLAGSNFFNGDEGDDYIIGGGGYDYSTRTQQFDFLEVVSGQKEQQTEWFASYHATAWQGLDGDDDDDHIFGGVGYNTIDGGDDDDFIFGPSGYHGNLLVVDYYRFDGPVNDLDEFLDYQLAYADLHTRSPDASSDGFEEDVYTSIVGSSGNDTVYGTIGDLEVSGASGEDVIVGSVLPNIEHIVAEGHGHGIEAALTWFNPTGLDTVDGLNGAFFGDHFFGSLAGDYTLDSGSVNWEFSALDTMDYDYIQNGQSGMFWNWDFNFEATRNVTNNFLKGQSEDDEIFGGIGNNVIEGGSDEDFLYGGTGYNHSSFSFSGDSDPTPFSFEGEVEWAYNSLFGQSGFDVLTGGVGFNWLDGGSENDLITAGGPSNYDHEDFINGLDDLETHLGGAGDTRPLFASPDLLPSGDAPSEHGTPSSVTGTDAGQDLDDFSFDVDTDPSAGVTLLSLFFDNILIGGGGAGSADTLIGGAGQDLFLFDIGDADPTSVGDETDNDQIGLIGQPSFKSGDAILFLGYTSVSISTGGSGATAYSLLNFGSGSEEITVWGDVTLTDTEIDDFTHPDFGSTSDAVLITVA